MNLEEALERFGLKISETDKEQDLERYNEDSQKFKRMLEESKLHTFGLNSPATTERKVAVVLAGQIGGGKSRLVGVDAHNATYEGVPETLGILEQEGLADRIEVYVRGKDARKPKMVYSSDWKENIYETAKEALLAERRKDRQRARTTIERRLYNIKNPHSRVLSQTEIDKISELESQLRQIEQEMESMERNDPDSQDR